MPKINKSKVEHRPHCDENLNMTLHVDNYSFQGFFFSLYKVGKLASDRRSEAPSNDFENTFLIDHVNQEK